MLMSGTTSISDCTQTLGRQSVSQIVWWTHENTPLDRILHSGKCLQYSPTAAHLMPLQNPYTKCMSQYRYGKTQKALFQHLTINCWLWSHCRNSTGLAVNSRMDIHSA